MARAWLWAALAAAVVVLLGNALTVRCADVPRGMLALLVCEPRH